MLPFARITEYQKSTVSVFHISIVTVTFTLVFQIAAKIGGDAGPPMNNNAALDGFPFPAQKRQLEDAGSSDHIA